MLVPSSRRVLDPMDRMSEVLFGLIMVLTFTGSLSVADAARDDVRVMLVGALGCNLAWGIIDGVFYIMGSLAEKGRDLATRRAVRGARDPAEGRRLLADALPPLVASVVRPAEVDALVERLRQGPEPPSHARLDGDDWRGALRVVLLVFLSTLPVAIPFLVLSELRPALRVSNLVAMALLFGIGHAYGRHAGRRPWATGVAMVLLGGVLVGLTIALGG